LDAPVYGALKKNHS